MKLIEIHGLPLLQFERFGLQDGVIHAISTRRGGVSEGQFSTLNLSSSGGDAPLAVEENRRRVLAALGIEPIELAMMGQIHDRRCSVVKPRPGIERRPFERRTDALVTDLLGTALLALCADCAPVLLWDPVNRAIGAAHAGWRGALGGVVESAVETMQASFGTDPGDLHAAVGPCIGPCCYEVREHVLGPLASAVPEPGRFVAHPRADHAHLDLPALLQWQLEQLGVPTDNVELSGRCTACDTATFFSHRAEHGRTGRFGAFIALRC